MEQSARNEIGNRIQKNGKRYWSHATSSHANPIPVRAGRTRENDIQYPEPRTVALPSVCSGRITFDLLLLVILPRKDGKRKENNSAAATLDSGHG
jgi:hypothetical protein